MKISQDVKLDYDDVLISPRHSNLESRQDVKLERDFKFYNSDKKLTCIPIAIANMSGVGIFNVANIASKYKIITCLHKHYTLNELIQAYSLYNEYNIQEYVWQSIGMKETDLNKILEFSKITGYKPNINIDIANGHIQKFTDYVKRVRDLFPESIISAGNVVIPELVYSLILSGADIVKCGLGSGKLCQSRLVTHCGYPQLSCNIECSDVAHSLKRDTGGYGLIIGDGGIRTIGHFSIGVATADIVMSGSFFAGVEESGSKEDWVCGPSGNKQSLKFFGMASEEAQNRFNGGIPEYGTSEGLCQFIPNKGKLSTLIENIMGGLRSTACYIGAKEIRDFNKCTSLIKVNNIVSN